MSALKYWLWLTELPGLTNQTRLALLQHFPTPEDVYYAEAEEVLLTEGITREQDPAGEQGLRRCGPDFGGLPAAECEHPHPPGRGVSQPAAEYLRPALSAVCPGPPAGF